MTPEFTTNELQYILAKLEQVPLANLKEAAQLTQIGKRLNAFVTKYLEQPKEATEVNA